MKIVLTIFSPFLVTIAWRIIAFILVIAIGIVVMVFNPDYSFSDALRDASFDMFNWGDSWFFWVIDIIAIFFAEATIWSE